MPGYRFSDDEAGFIAVHIHSGLSNEEVTDTLRTTQLIDESMMIIEKSIGRKLPKESLAYIRLMSHLYYMIVRLKTEEAVNLDLNEFVRQNCPNAGRIAEIVCRNMSRKMQKGMFPEEVGFLAIHIQRMIAAGNKAE